MKTLRSRKWISLVLGSLVTLSTLSGCGNKTENSFSTSPDATATDANASEAVIAEDVSKDTIEINRSDDYQFDAEEIMYLSGVKAAAYTPGVKYTLKDMNEDEISELFISVNDTISVYSYDEELDMARKTSEYDDQIESILNDTSINWVDDKQWVDGTIFGTELQTGDPGIKTDYYTSSNYEWLSQTNVKTQGDSVTPVTVEKTPDEKKEEIFEDRDKYNSDDIQRIRDLYDIASNWEKRNAEGLEPAQKYFNAIESIDSIDAMTEYVVNPDINPFATFVSFQTTLNLEENSHWIAEIQGADYSVLPRYYNNDDAEALVDDRKEFDVKVRYILDKIGYSDDDVEQIMKNFYEIENQLLEADWSDDEEELKADELSQYSSIEDIAAKCENFPLLKMFNAYNITKGQATVQYPSFLRTLDSLYTEDNLDYLKAYCLVNTAYKVSDYTDLDAKNAYINYCIENASSSDASEDWAYVEADTEEALNDSYLDLYLSNRELMGVAAENAYMTYCVDDKAREDLTSLANEIKDTFREILINEEWMSESGRKAAIEKLDNMEFSVLKPDEFIDSSYLSVNTESNFLDAMATITVNTKKHNGELVGNERTPSEWRYDIRSEVSTTVNNCFYYGAFNHFYILDGFLNDKMYNTNMSKEEKLGAIGEVIGHELTHGFDPLGITYDKNGNMVATDENPSGWLPEEDYNAFNEKTDKLIAYFDKIVPYPYNKCDGTIYKEEAAADIGGMTIGLKIAEKQENFDYDLYFRTHSKLWVAQSTLIVERDGIFDGHPLDYLRINTTCQQFDEFYNTYDIKEGDLMYLAPEDRVKIW